jgi:hypothetical protein
MVGVALNCCFKYLTQAMDRHGYTSTRIAAYMRSPKAHTSINHQRVYVLVPNRGLIYHVNRVRGSFVVPA